MKYLCLVYFEPKALTTLTENEQAVLDNESLAYDEELQRSGHFIAAEALDSVKSAVTVRMRNGKISTTDGPFAETKESLGGLVVLALKNVDEAIALLSTHPALAFGIVMEIRPIDEVITKRWEALQETVA